MSTAFLAPTSIVAILIAITIHEWAHAYTAYKLGDDTARWAGRLTWNPLAHLDLLGALMFLFVGFGWAKPVPVDPRNFRHPTRDSALVAIAGPISNLVLAFIAAALLSFLAPATGVQLETGMSAGNAALTIFLLILQSSLVINLALMAFNLLPVPPLDGSNILRLFIPWQWSDQYEQFMRNGPWILLALLLAESFTNIPILSAWVYTIIDAVLMVFALIL